VHDFLVGMEPIALAFAATFGLMAIFNRKGPKWWSSLQGSVRSTWSRRTYFRQACYGLAVGTLFFLFTWLASQLIGVRPLLGPLQLLLSLLFNAFFAPLMNVTYPPVIDDWLDWGAREAEHRE
jgi:hypothetical protein